jgi:flagellin-like hook-associated protein FlgL
MTISSFRPGNPTGSASDLFVSMRRDLLALQRQLVTGQKADSYGGLGFDRRTSLDGRAKLAALETSMASIDQADLRIRMMTQNLERLNKLALDTKSDLTVPKFEPLSDGRTFAQKTAEQRLKEAIDLLNTDLAGRSLFAGRAVDTLPVESYDRIMNGDGNAIDGLKAVIEERLAANRGANGLGRLGLSQPASNQVRIAQEGDGLPFGFRIGAVSTTGTAITHAEGTAPTPSSVFTVGGLPNDGDTVTVTLTDPVGTEHTVRLTARTTLVPGEAGGFQIGANADETAANLMAALEKAVKGKVDTELLPAAAMDAAESFFNDPSSLQRVDGAPPFTSATGWSATPRAVIGWYKGDDADPANARTTAPVRVDDTQVVAAGAQANEAAIANVLSQLAVTAVTPFSSSDGDFYTALTEEVYGKLADKPANPKVNEIATELANASAAMKAAKARHEATENMLLDAVQDVEQASPEETSLAILDLQTKLQASYQTTSILSRLSLVNYL